MSKLLNKLIKIIIVVSNLKLIQIYYFVRKHTFFFNNKTNLKREFINLNFHDLFEVKNSYCKSTNSFNFLNQLKEFKDSINWNYSQNGLLWTYNLNYFDFINQKNLNNEDRVKLIKSFQYHYKLSFPMADPYPTSLRIINLVKLIGSENILFKNQIILNIIYEDTRLLMSRIEYHLLGNHLLENGIALLFVSFVIDDKKILDKSFEILNNEIKEQILDDGAHFELCTMYHHIILKRFIELSWMISLNPRKVNNKFTNLINTAICKMLSWASIINLNKHCPPLINDSASNSFPSFNEILKCSKKLNFKYDILPLSQSGFRVMNSNKLHLIADVSNILSSYQAGHSHADSLNFLIYFNNKPFIIDPGISTYENNTTRNHERKTSFHNTVSINGDNSSDVWGAFRVSNRAKTKIIKESINELTASHDGFKNKFNATHHRCWSNVIDGFEIEDQIITKKNNLQYKAYLHFDHTVNLNKNKKLINSFFFNDVIISFEGAINIKIEKYNQPDGYNRNKVSNRIVVTFKKKLLTRIFQLNN
jgi:hypothetical protein